MLSACLIVDVDPAVVVMSSPFHCLVYHSQLSSILIKSTSHVPMFLGMDHSSAFHHQPARSSSPWPYCMLSFTEFCNASSCVSGLSRTIFYIGPWLYASNIADEILIILCLGVISIGALHQFLYSLQDLKGKQNPPQVSENPFLILRIDVPGCWRKRAKCCFAPFFFVVSSFETCMHAVNDSCDQLLAVVPSIYIF